MYLFGRRSKQNLYTCHSDLIDIISLVMSWQVMDFSVIEGHRSLERQQRFFREGRSYIDGITKKGSHNYNPSRGVDLLPYPNWLNGVNVWNDKHRFLILGGLMYAAASQLKIKIRAGLDWDGDGNAKDQLFHDMPHYELV